MSKPAQRVVARFLQADAIGNVHDILQKWQVALKQWAEKEARLPSVLEAYQAVKSDTATQEQRRHFERSRYDYLFFPKFSYTALTKLVGVPELFWAILQQYDLPAPVRKKVEQYSKYYAKASARNPKGKDFEVSAQLFRDLLNTYREQFTVATAIARAGKLRGTDIDGVKVLNAGPFKVVNTGGFDQATMEKAARVVEEAAKLLSAKGLDRVCYGEVLVSKSIQKSKTLAFYVLASDEVFIRSDLKGKETAAVRTVLHELGHRLQHKFLKSQTLHISSLHYKIKRGQDALEQQAVDEAMADPNKKPKPGDLLTDSRKRNFVVDAVDYNFRGGYTVKLHLAEDEMKKFRMTLKSYLALKGIKPDVPKATGFVTLYAATNADENFAEMIAHYCMDDLPDEQITMLQPIIS